MDRQPWIIVCYMMAASCLLPISLQMSTLWQHQRHLGNKIVYPDEYLHHLGYLEDGHGFWLHTRGERQRAIRSYQQAFGLPQTGKIDKKTWRLMKEPRCAVPDVGAISSNPSPWKQPNKDGLHRSKREARSKAINLGNYKYKWTIPHIRWQAGRLSSKLPYDTQKALFTEAFRRWTRPINMIVSESSGNRDREVEIGFNRYEHGDGYSNAFDGRGRLLAHAFPPGDVDISGDIHFDLDEPWTFGVNTTKKRTRDLMMTTMHEVGHAMGLPHSTDTRDIMYPRYLDYDSNPQLSRRDVSLLQAIYGAKPGYKLPRKKLKKGKEARRFRVNKKLPKWCRQKFNAVVLGPDKVGLVFIKKKVYRINNQGVLPGYPVHVGHEFPGAPINPITVFYVAETNKFYFFKGDRIWRFSNRTLDKGYPQKSKSIFYKRLSTAVAMSDSRGRTLVYFFGEKYQWRWDFYQERTHGRYNLISRYWRGLPEPVDAAVEWPDGYLYFFQHNKYYKVSKRRKSVMQGYPLFKGAAWLGGECGSEPK